MQNFKFIWKIENFNFLPPQRGKALRSPPFNVHLLGSTILELYPKGDILDPHDESIIVCLNNCTKLPNTSVSCDLQLMTVDSSIKFKSEKIHDCTKWKFTRDQQSHRFGCSSDSINNEFSKSTLTVTCHFSQSSSVTKSSKHTLGDSKDMIVLSEDMKKLYIDQQFCDITLCTENQKFPAHKAILFARLPKLVSDLESDDNSSELKHLENMEPEVARYLLNYAYSGKLSVILSSIPSGLYPAAQLLDLNDLKQKMYAYPNEVNARTYIKVDRNVFIWPIKDIHTMDLSSKKYSPAFAGGVIDCSDLKLVCYLAQNAEGEESLEICIHRLFPDKEKPIFVKCKITVIDQLNLFRCAEHVFNGDQEWHFPSFISVKRKGKDVIVGHNKLANHGIPLKCEFSISGCEISVIEETECSLAKYEHFIHHGEDVSNLSHDLGKLYNIFLPRVSDVTLLIGTVKFPAHKAVLAARSPVFSRMFSNDMLEKKSGQVKITDIDIAVLNMMLNYIYSAKVDILHYDSAIKLYSAADKYEVTVLKEKCASYLRDVLCNENVCDILLLADMHGDVELKKFSKEFINAHADAILETPQWKNLMDTRLDLASEILHSLVKTVLNHNKECSKCNQ